MKKENRNYSLLVLALVAATFLATPFVKAQSPTPSTNTVPPLVTATPSISTTPTPTETVIETPVPTPTPKVEIITTSVSIGTQYPWNKKVPIKLSITPSQSGSKLEIRWQKKAGLVASPSVRTIANPQAGRTYTASFSLTPYAPGFQRAVADIILTTNTTNYVTSKDVPLQMDIKKTVIPKTTTYTMYTIGMYLFVFLLFFVIIPFGIYQAYLYIKKYVIPKWLESKIQSPI